MSLLNFPLHFPKVVLVVNSSLQHVPEPLWRSLFWACRGCQEPSALSETLLGEMEQNQHRAKPWPGRVNSSRRRKGEQTATSYSTASVSGLKTATNLWKLPKLTQSPLCCLVFTLWSKHCQLWISYKQGAEVKQSLVLIAWPHIKFLFCLVCCTQKD